MKNNIEFKKYNLELYEIEIIFLYKLFKSLKTGKIPLTESKLKKIIENNPEFRIWDGVIKEIENESNC